MDRLVFFIQQRGSMCRKILFSIFIVFTVINKSTPNQEVCTINNKRNVSYFEVNIQEANWTTAWLECMKQQARLPIICNKDEQDAFISHIKEIGGSSTVWTAGKRTNFPNWTWINRQRYMGRDEIIITLPAGAYETHAVLNEKLRYKSAYPGLPNFYLCQYSGSSCNSGDVINVTDGCVRASDDYRKWYDARNQCLMNDGDLAILNDADLVTLSRRKRLNAGYSYFVGLRNYTWHWIYQQTVDSSEIKYTNWSNADHYFPNNECVSINASNGEWKAVKCANNNRVICERTSEYATSERSSEIPTTISSTAVTTGNELSVLLSACHERESQSVSQTTLNAVVIVGIFTIVISDIAVALVVRKYASRKSSNVSSRTETTEGRSYQDLETTRRQANSDGTYTDLQLQPVYEEVSQRGK